MLLVGSLPAHLADDAAELPRAAVKAPINILGNPFLGKFFSFFCPEPLILDKQSHAAQSRTGLA